MVLSPSWRPVSCQPQFGSGRVVHVGQIDARLGYLGRFLVLPSKGDRIAHLLEYHWTILEQGTNRVPVLGCSTGLLVEEDVGCT